VTPDAILVKAKAAINEAACKSQTLNKTSNPSYIRKSKEFQALRLEIKYDNVETRKLLGARVKCSGCERGKGGAKEGKSAR